MRLTQKSKWRRLLSWLRREQPLTKRVRVRQKHLKYQGDCEYVNHCFNINIESRQCYNLRMDALLHEWAHAQTWFGNDMDDHGSEWGLAYARLYRCFLTWNYGKGPEDEETQ